MNPTVMRSEGAVAPSAPKTDDGRTSGAATAANAALTNCRRVRRWNDVMLFLGFPPLRRRRLTTEPAERHASLNRGRTRFPTYKGTEDTEKQRRKKTVAD